MTMLAATQTITQDIPWGQIAPWAFGSVAVIAVTVLAILGKLPGIKAKIGDKELTVDDDQAAKAYQGPERRTDAGTCPELSTADLYAPLLVTKRRAEATTAAWVRQKTHADEIEDDFWPVLERRCCDPWQAEAACSRLHRVLYTAADQNHILEVVVDGQVDVDYLEGKVQAFRRRYDKLQARTGCTLPAFPQLSEEVRSLLASALVRFAEIAQEEDAKVDAFADALKRTTEAPEAVRAIDEAAKRGLPEVA
jgi:hypothetical protein